MELYDALIGSIPAEETVTEAVRGRQQAYVETEGGAGLASLPLPNKTPYADAAVYAEWAGRPLRDLAAKIRSDDMREAALGCAAINAWFNRRSTLESLGVTLYPPEIDLGDVFRTLEPECSGRLVSTVGHFHGGEKLQGMRELRVFEKDPRPGDLPEQEEDRLLPESEIVVITGMALTNGTMPHLLELCRNAEIVALSGPSVPMTPLWFDFGVTALFGTLCWDIPGCRRAIRTGGHRQTWPHMGKAVLRK